MSHTLHWSHAPCSSSLCRSITICANLIILSWLAPISQTEVNFVTLLIFEHVRYLWTLTEYYEVHNMNFLKCCRLVESIRHFLVESNLNLGTIGHNFDTSHILRYQISYMVCTVEESQNLIQRIWEYSWPLGNRASWTVQVREDEQIWQRFQSKKQNYLNFCTILSSSCYKLQFTISSLEEIWLWEMGWESVYQEDVCDLSSFGQKGYAAVNYLIARLSLAQVTGLLLIHFC